MTATSAAEGSHASQEIPDDDRVPVLEPALWKQLGETGDLATFCNAWLTLQCGLIGGAAGAAVVVGREPTSPPIAVWPQGFNPLALMAVVGLAVEQRRGVAHFGGAEAAAAEDGTTAVTTAVLAFPLIIDDPSDGIREPLTFWVAWCLGPNGVAVHHPAAS